MWSLEISTLHKLDFIFYIPEKCGPSPSSTRQRTKEGCLGSERRVVALFHSNISGKLMVSHTETGFTLKNYWVHTSNKKGFAFWHLHLSTLALQKYQ